MDYRLLNSNPDATREKALDCVVRKYELDAEETRQLKNLVGHPH